MPTRSIDLPDDLDAGLRDAADAAGLTAEEYVLATVRERIEAHRRGRVMETARRIVESDAAILHRLATA